METIQATGERVGTIASSFQHLQSPHVVRKTYPDPVVFDRNGDGHFDVMDIVSYAPTWERGHARVVQTAEQKPAEQDSASVHENPAGLKQYERQGEDEDADKHAVEVTA